MDRLTDDQERYLDDARRQSYVPAPPPTIAAVIAEGCIGFHVCCSGPGRYGRCGHWRLIRWEEVQLDPSLPFPEIRRHIRARCTKCGCREFHVVPDHSHEKRPGY